MGKIQVSLSSLLNAGLSHFGLKVSRLERVHQVMPGNRYPLNIGSVDGIDLEGQKILNLISYAKNSTNAYNAEKFEAGYHTFKINGREFKGQRDPEKRLKDVPFDFDGASVLDIGSNQGGMLLSIAHRIKAGVGVDFDYKMVNLANRIAAHDGRSNLRYYVFDLDKEKLEILRNFFCGGKIDIIFLLSVCMWLKNWQSVIDAALSMSDALLFESNGTEAQQAEQEAYLKSAYSSVVLVRDASTDDVEQLRRRLFICRSNTADPVLATIGAG